MSGIFFLKLLNRLRRITVSATLEITKMTKDKCSRGYTIKYAKTLLYLIIFKKSLFRFFIF